MLQMVIMIIRMVVFRCIIIKRVNRENRTRSFSSAFSSEIVRKVNSLLVYLDLSLIGWEANLYCRWCLVIVLSQVDHLLVPSFCILSSLLTLDRFPRGTRTMAPYGSRFCRTACNRWPTHRTIGARTNGHRDRYRYRNAHTLLRLRQLPDRLCLALHQLHQGAVVQALKVLHFAWCDSSGRD